MMGFAGLLCTWRHVSRSMCYVAGFWALRAQGVGLGLRGLGFRVQGLELRGLGFRLQGLGVQGLGGLGCATVTGSAHWMIGT